MIVVARDRDIVGYAQTHIAQLTYELERALIAVADKRRREIFGQLERLMYLSLVRAVAYYPVLPQRQAVLKERFVIAEVSVLNA